MNLIFEEAYEEIQQTASLSLPTRKRIWLHLGEVSHEPKLQALSDGIRKRVKLAQACIHKAFPIWAEGTGGDSKLYALLNQIDAYIEGLCSNESLQATIKILYSQLETDAYDPRYEKTSLIGFAAIYMANIALYDELLFQNSEDTDLDNDLDSFTWDTSYLIGLVYSDSTEEETRIERQREYWSWYVTEAQRLQKEAH
ncbi:MAG: hypothetical protein K0Q90_3284 [Paenibacillaceae bacterium]|jgi:hypothetical protein|nr:hypothetical protein [Paenibacillaceae bacterium]